MQAQDWQLNRRILRFDVTAEEGTITLVKPMIRRAYVMPIDRFHCAFEDSLAVDVQTLTQLASAWAGWLHTTWWLRSRKVCSCDEKQSPPRFNRGGLVDQIKLGCNMRSP